MESSLASGEPLLAAETAAETAEVMADPVQAGQISDVAADAVADPSSRAASTAPPGVCPAPACDAAALPPDDAVPAPVIPYDAAMDLGAGLFLDSAPLASAVDMESNGPPSPAGAPAIDYDLTQRFPSCPIMNQSIMNYASAMKFIARNFPKEYFKEADYPFDGPFEKSVPRRGYFLCSPKSGKRLSKEKCTFKVFFLWCLSTKVYYLNQQKSCLMHNHDLADHKISLDGKVEAVYIQDLNEAENEYLEECALAHMDGPKMLTNMERKFPGRTFSTDLLKREREKHLNNRYGKDRCDFKGLYEKAEIVRGDGGVFDGRTLTLLDHLRCYF